MKKEIISLATFIMLSFGQLACNNVQGSENQTTPQPAKKNDTIIISRHQKTSTEITIKALSATNLCSYWTDEDQTILDSDTSKCKGIKKNNWSLQADSDIYTGTSMCSQTNKANQGDTPKPVNKPGNNCWCKTDSSFAYVRSYKKAQNCSNECAFICTMGILGNPEVRSALGISKNLEFQR